MGPVGSVTAAREGFKSSVYDLLARQGISTQVILVRYVQAVPGL